MPRPKTTNLYFHSGIEDAIHAYNLTTDERERNRLFNIIYPALTKLCEVWFNKIKPVYVNLTPEEMQLDCITFILERLHMIKEGKGKAFSYITVTARNFYIQLNMKAYSSAKKGLSISLDGIDIADVPTNRVEEMEWTSLVFKEFIEYLTENFDTIFNSKPLKRFGKVFLDKINTDGLAEGFNRRAFLNDVSAKSGIERGLIQKHVNKVASIYTTFYQYFEIYGQKPSFETKSVLSETDKEYIRSKYKHYCKHYGLNGISRSLGVPYDIVKNYVRTTL